MRKIPVIPGGHEKHSDVVEGNADDQVRPLELQEKCRRASQVDRYKRERPDDRDSIAVFEGNEADGQESSSLRPIVPKRIRERRDMGRRRAPNSVSKLQFKDQRSRRQAVSMSGSD